MSKIASNQFRTDAINGVEETFLIEGQSYSGSIWIPRKIRIYLKPLISSKILLDFDFVFFFLIPLVFNGRSAFNPVLVHGSYRNPHFLFRSNPQNQKNPNLAFQFFKIVHKNYL